MGFNNNDFDAESYVKVNVRLQEFWAKYPQGRLETEVGYNDGVLIVMARLYRTAEEKSPFATGHSFLQGLDGEKVGEYTETVAVGRALALAGFKVEKSIASSEEMVRFGNRKKQAKASIDLTKEDKVTKVIGTPIIQDVVETDASRDLPKLKANGRFKLPKRDEVQG